MLPPLVTFYVLQNLRYLRRYICVHVVGKFFIPYYIEFEPLRCGISIFENMSVFYANEQYITYTLLYSLFLFFIFLKDFRKTNLIQQEKIYIFSTSL